MLLRRWRSSPHDLPSIELSPSSCQGSPARGGALARAHIRRDESKSDISSRINLWITWSLRLAFLALLAPCAVSLARHATAKKSFTVLDAYAVVCGIRLAIDLVVRTYYSGVYALQRIH